MMLKTLPLNLLHLELGAKMAPFAGYAMPLHYGAGIIREHLHCRNHAGFFDISHMGQFSVDGDDAAGALERLTPSDISGLRPGFQKYTVLTLDNGGVLDDIIASRTASGLFLIVNAACKDKDFAYLRQHLRGLRDLQNRALFALQGPKAEAVIKKFSPAAASLKFMHSCQTELDGSACFISRSGYTGEDGFEISVGIADAERLARLLLAEDGVAPVGLGARDTLRLEAGLCLYGHELNETITPVEAGLNWIIKKGHDRFPGAEKILAQLRDGTDLIRAGLIVEGKAPIREGAPLSNDKGQAVGHVTSGSFAPSLGKPVALARLDKAYAAAGTRLFTEVRGREVALSVTTLPFIPHRYRR
ncbi:glycine cleavage system aminomethyltransferase GcvT [Methylomicrobium sp. Wu6]|uniref:glycine cleavage system aminomethyltransferase GcvT n=1 Tax=Methylomicrobium sp. Wu6 TaxID=3107928 RepID=UPI002DD69F80|nr:glycine cleavage system aminomethyltransferase GcvT [Methylomicrobium sp. Wu6]MEC4747649.1 glycine cleavage system aminomethyltransferase GcvT [Methylomicrobium sp. Wu6]